MNLTAMDQHEFGGTVEKHRRELQAHCYRMLGSVQDAEDMVQETFLRAWNRRETYEGRATLRAWLYKISTNLCLDALKRHSRRAVPVTRGTASSSADPIPPEIREPIWLEPYPDHLLASDDHNPEEYLSARENIALAFIAALHLLPPRQRAALVLCDVLDWQANEAAALMETTIPAIKSALHRARSTLAAHPSAPSEPDESIQTQLSHYVHAWEGADVNALVKLLKDDATFSMPPTPSWYQGRESIRELTSKSIFSGDRGGRWRLLPTHANGQPAFGLYRHANGDTYNAYGIQVLTFRGGLIADITTFRTPELVSYFKLPPKIGA